MHHIKELDPPFHDLMAKKNLWIEGVRLDVYVAINGITIDLI